MSEVTSVVSVYSSAYFRLVCSEMFSLFLLNGNFDLIKCLAHICGSPKVWGGGCSTERVRTFLNPALIWGAGQILVTATFALQMDHYTAAMALGTLRATAGGKYGRWWAYVKKSQSLTSFMAAAYRSRAWITAAVLPATNVDYIRKQDAKASTCFQTCWGSSLSPLFHFLPHLPIPLSFHSFPLPSSFPVLLLKPASVHFCAL